MPLPRLSPGEASRILPLFPVLSILRIAPAVAILAVGSVLPARAASRAPALGYEVEFLAPPSTWLARPVATVGGRLRLTVRTPPGTTFVTGLFPSPDAVPDTYEADVADLDVSPYSGFGAFATSVVEVPGGTVAMAVAPGALDLPGGALISWVTASARAVAGYYGRFPVPRVLVMVLPGGRRPVRHHDGQRRGLDHDPGRSLRRRAGPGPRLGPDPRDGAPGHSKPPPSAALAGGRAGDLHRAAGEGAAASTGGGRGVARSAMPCAASCRPGAASEDLWRRLGVSVTPEGVRFDDGAPLAAVRRGLTAPTL